MKTIVLNSSNLQGTDNNKFVYKFPVNFVMKNNYIAVSSIYQYFSF